MQTQPSPYQVIPELFGNIEPEKLEQAIEQLNLKPMRLTDEQDFPVIGGEPLRRSILMLAAIIPTEKGPNLALVQQAEKANTRLYRVMGTLHFDNRYSDGFAMEFHGNKPKFVRTMFNVNNLFLRMLDGCGVPTVTPYINREKPRFIQLPRVNK